MKKDLVSSFNKKVLSFFTDYDIPLSENVPVCLGVSGGADSISLLISLSYISSKKNIPLKVITINHKIRPDSETDADCEYVFNLCEKIKNHGINIECKIQTLKKGLVFETEKIRQNGIEEAARFLRYKKFENFAEENNSKIFCIAHNKDDQVETLLMRFLQGSKIGSSGISENRNIFYRPLLNISRNEIEEYLKNQNILWKTDSTNFSTDYLRNKIRLNLIPMLNKNFSGWQKSVLSGGLKAKSDEEFIQKFVNNFKINIEFTNSEKTANFSLKEFENLHNSVQIRVLYKLLNNFVDSKRIRFKFIQELQKIILNYSEKKQTSKYTTNILNLEFTIHNKIICVKNQKKLATDSGFFGIIEEEGIFNFPFGKIKVTSEKTIIFYSNDKIYSFECKKFPVCIRSFEIGDKVKMACGEYKNISDIFTDWHVESKHKKLIPIVQNFSENLEILCILGNLYGYKDWIL